jgi:mannose-6-phosphate isomerase-like protein (cupin superfamily)
MTFYDKWLTAWDETEAEKQAARKVIHEEELDWVQTQQDHRAALLIAPENGFRTMGSLTMVAEIPVGWHTGDHKHGEEAIFIVSGSGSSVVDGRRYDWGQGSVLAIPFGARHQHFNTGPEPVRYFSVLSVHLERFAGLHRTVQFDSCGAGSELPDVEVSIDGLDATGRRIALANQKDAPPAPETRPEAAPAPAPSAPAPSADEKSLLAGETLVVGDIEGFHRVMHLHRTAENMQNFMRVGRDQNEFSVHEQEISSILTDPANEYSGKHAHQEALLYILDGFGHSVIEGETVHWRPGSALHVQGPQTVHQHFVESSTPSKMLRVSSGLRYFFEPMLKTEWPYLFMTPRQAVVEGRAAAGSSSE